MQINTTLIMTDNDNEVWGAAVTVERKPGEVYELTIEADSRQITVECRGQPEKEYDWPIGDVEGAFSIVGLMYLSEVIEG